MTYILALDAAENEDLKNTNHSADDVLVRDIEGGVPAIVKDLAFCWKYQRYSRELGRARNLAKWSFPGVPKWPSK